MDNLTTQSVVINGHVGSVQYLNEGTIAYACGNGMVLQDVETGAQRRVLGSPSQNASTSAGPAVFAVCPEQQLLAYAQHGPDTAVHIVTAANLQPIATIKDASKNEWLSLSLSKDGSRLLSVSGFPQYHLDIWDIEQSPQDSTADSNVAAQQPPDGLLGTRNTARVPLGDRLTGLGAAMFPLNTNVACACGTRAVRIICLDPLPNHCGVRQAAGTRLPTHQATTMSQFKLMFTPVHALQADVDLSVLEKSETLTAFCWSPNGTLLLGTSTGRLLTVRGAAPMGLPGRGWEAGASLAAAVLMGTNMVPATGHSQVTGSIVHIVLTLRHITMVTSGGPSGSAQLVWLDAISPDGSGAITCEVPGMHGVTCASLSPSGQRFVLSGSSGTLSLCDAVFTTAGPMAGGGTGVTTAAAPAIASRLLARLHADGIIATCAIAGQLAVTAGADGTLQVWSYSQPDISAPGDSGITARAVAVCHLGQALTAMAACRRSGQACQDVLVATASGELLVLSIHRTAAAATAATAAADEGPTVEVYQLRVCWEMRVFDGAVSAVALNQQGDCCAAACASRGQVVFFKVMTGSPEIAMQLLGFYAIKEPSLLAFAPASASAEDLSASGGAAPKSTCTLYSGPPPLLVVGSINGALWVLQAPDKAHVNRSPDAEVPAGSLVRGFLRVQSIVTAIATAPTGSPGGGKAGAVAAADGMFWVFVACADKSVRRFRLLTDAQRAAVKSALEPPRHALMAAQNFQAPEMERTMDLGMPASQLAICSAGKHLVAACRDGIVVLYGLPDLSAHGRWGFHDPATSGCTSTALQGGTLLTAGGDGVFNVVEMVTASVAASAARRHATGPRSRAASGLLGAPSGGLRSPSPQLKSPGSRQQRAGSLTPAFSVESPGAAFGGFKAGERLGVAEPLFSGAPVVEVHLKGVADKAPTWREARLQSQALARHADMQAFQQQLHKQKAAWSRKLQDLHARNNAAEESERLPPSDFVIDVGLQGELRQAGDKRVAAAAAAAKKAMLALEIVRERVHGLCVSSLEQLQQELLPLPEYSFISTLNADDLKRWKDVGPVVKVQGIASYPLRKLPKDQAAKLRKIKFLRQVEQEEWSQRPATERGQVATIKTYKGPMAGTWNLSDKFVDSEKPTPRGGANDAAAAQQEATLQAAAATLPATAAAAAQPAAASDEEDDELEEDGVDIKHHAAVPDGDNIVGNEVFNGACNLLYAPFQLHTTMRKISQVVLVEEEVRELQRSFNAKFKQMKEEKQKEMDRIEERLARVVEIQKALEAPPEARQPLTQYAWSPSEEGDEVLQVQDSEVKVEKYVSPEERARREEEARVIEEGRRRAEADDSAQRALREMMHGTLESKKKANAIEGMKREAWMELPRHQLTKEQRLLLVEWEKRVAELAEEADKQRRQLEAERKVLEVEVADVVIEFNARLAVVHQAKVRMDEECRSLELQLLECAIAANTSMHAAQRQQQYQRQLEGLVGLRDRRSRAVALVATAADRAIRKYEDLSSQEKQMDKAFRREFGVRADLYDDLAKIYKDRRRGLTGLAVRNATELLDRVPEGQQPPGSAGSPRRSRSTTPLPPSPVSTHRQNTAKNGDQGAGAATPDEDLPPPPIMPELQLWARQAPRSEGDGPAAGNSRQAEIPSTPRHVPRGSTGTSRLRALAAGSSRALDPLLQMAVAGTSLSSLHESGQLGVLGLGLPDAGAGAEAAQDPFSNPAMRSIFEAGAAREVMQQRRDEEEGYQQMSEAPWDQAGKPEGLEESWWSRLLEMRDSRVVLEQEADMAWSRACHLSVALEGLEADEAEAIQRLTQLNEHRLQLQSAVQRLDIDAPLLYNLTYGQVDLLEPAAIAARAGSTTTRAGTSSGDALHEMHGACFLRRAVVEKVNRTILDHGSEKVELLQALKQLKQAIFLAKWENQRGQLRIKHATEELTDMQLLHATKELQVALNNPGLVSKSGSDQEQRMMKLIDGSTTCHNQRTSLRKDKLTLMTERVAANIEEHEEVTLAERHADAAFRESSRVHDVTARNNASAEAEQRRHLRAIVTNKQLKDIASEQVLELAKLRQQLAKEKERVFPMLVPPDWTPPDLRPPMSAAQGQRRPASHQQQQRVAFSR